MKWVNIGGRGFPPMGQPTGEPSIVFWYGDTTSKDEYVLVQSSSNMNPVVTGTGGTSVSVALRQGEKRHLHIDLARSLWDYVMANGWSIKGSGEEK
jgi:hypothetical protein